MLGGQHDAVGLVEGLYHKIKDLQSSGRGVREKNRGKEGGPKRRKNNRMRSESAKGDRTGRIKYLRNADLKEKNHKRGPPKRREKKGDQSDKLHRATSIRSGVTAVEIYGKGEQVKKSSFWPPCDSTDTQYITKGKVRRVSSRVLEHQGKTRFMHLSRK